MAMRALISELRALHELDTGDAGGGDETPDQVKARTGKCPPGFHAGADDRCVPADDTPQPDDQKPDDQQEPSADSPDAEPEVTTSTDDVTLDQLNKWADDEEVPPETKELINNDDARSQAAEAAAADVNANAAKATDEVSDEDEEKADEVVKKKKDGEDDEEGIDWLGGLMKGMAGVLVVGALASAGFGPLSAMLAGPIAVYAGAQALDWLFGGGEEAAGDDAVTKEKMAFLVAKAVNKHLKTQGISKKDMLRAVQENPKQTKSPREAKLRRMREFVEH